MTALPAKITIATEVWEPGYTKADSSGLYEDIIRNIFPGTTVEFIYSDYMRSKALVKKQSINMWLGAYLNEESYAIYPDTPIDYDEIIALYEKSVAQIQGKPNIQDAQMVWLYGYKYDKYFTDRSLQGIEVRTIETAVRLLRGAKVQFMLGDESELFEALKDLHIPIEQFEKVPFGNLGLYPGLPDTPLSRQLINIWDKQLTQMIASGRLLALYKQHGLDHRYLFDRSLTLKADPPPKYN